MNKSLVKRMLQCQSYTLTLATFLVFSSSAYAGFGVIEPDADTDFGNAQNETFKRAVDSEEPLSSADRRFMDYVQDNQYGQRWYWKALVARPSLELDKMTNDSTGLIGEPARPTSKTDVFQFAIALGYKWVRWAAEFELLISEGFEYRSNPILTGQPIALKTNVKPFALFANFEYEIPTFFDFVPNRLHPYANIGIGVGIKTADSQTLTLGGQSRQLRSDRKSDFAWQAGLGFRYQLTGSWLVDVAYRWYQLGDVRIGPIEGYLLKGKEISTRGFYLGLMYQK